MAKQVARIAAKKALADAAAKEDELLGGLVQLVMFATEQADTRSWETLPGWFSLVRIPLPTGEQNVVINIIHGSEDHKVDLGTINIEPGGMYHSRN